MMSVLSRVTVLLAVLGLTANALAIGIGANPPTGQQGAVSPIVSLPPPPTSPGAAADSCRVLVLRTPKGRVVSVERVAVGESLVITVGTSGPLVLDVVGMGVAELVLPVGSTLVLTVL